MYQLKYILFVFFIIMSTCSIFCSSFAGTSAVNDKERLDFASSSLNNYVKNAISEQNVGNFGFKSLGEAQDAKVGKAYPVISLDLQEIKAYRAGAKVKSLKAKTETTWFPVTVSEEVVAKLEIIEKNGRMIAGDFGAGSEAKRMARTITESSSLLKSREITAEDSMQILRVPHLKADFLFIESPQGEYLIPAMALPGRYDLKNGELYPAVEVLGRLKKHAEEIPEGLIR